MAKRRREPDGQRREPPHAVDGAESHEAKDFFEELKLLSAEDWQKGWTSYGYRIEPVIDRRDGQHYVFKVNEPYDPDFVMRHWGSGKYLLVLNNPQGRTTSRKMLSVHNLDHPPRVDLNELVAGDPRNEKFFRTWGRPKEPAAPGGIPPGGAADGVAVQEFAKLNNKLVDLVQGRQSAPALEAAQATPVVALVRELKTLIPQQAPPDSLAVVDRVLSIADKLRAPAPPPAPATNPLADVQGLVGLARELKEIFLPEAVEKTTIRSRLDGWQEFSVAMAPYVSPILSPLTAMFAQVLGQKMLGGSPPPQAFVVTPPSPINPPQPAGQQPPGGQQSDGPVMMMPFLQWVAAPMVSYARMMAPPPNEEPVDPETAGADFASWVNEGFGANPNYDQAMVAARAMGPIGIMAAFRTTPLWTDKGPQSVMPSLAELEPKLPAFFNAFLNWTPEAAEDFEEDDDEPGAVKTFSESGTP
jgi:hypothetical protein